MGVYGCIGVGVLTVEIARKHRDPSHYSGRRGGTCGSQRRKSSERWSTSRWPFPGRIGGWVGKWVSGVDTVRGEGGERGRGSTSRWPFPGRISAWVGKWGKVRKGWVGRVRGGKRGRVGERRRERERRGQGSTLSWPFPGRVGGWGRVDRVRGGRERGEGGERGRRVGIY